MGKTPLEIAIESWWDNLNDFQQDWLVQRFFPEDNIDTLAKVVYCYNLLTREDLLFLSGLQKN